MKLALKDKYGVYFIVHHLFESKKAKLTEGDATFKKGDKVKLKKDVLEKHSKSVPAHSGYSKEQFSWRETLESLDGEVGEIERIFPNSKHVNVQFDSIIIGINNTELEKVVEENSKLNEETDFYIDVKRKDTEEAKNLLQGIKSIEYDYTEPNSYYFDNIKDAKEMLELFRRAGINIQDQNIDDMLYEEDKLDEQSSESEFNDAKTRVRELTKSLNKKLKITFKSIIQDFLKNGERGDAIGDLNALYNELGKVEI